MAWQRCNFVSIPVSNEEKKRKRDRGQETKMTEGLIQRGGERYEGEVEKREKKRLRCVRQGW